MQCRQSFETKKTVQKLFKTENSPQSTLLRFFRSDGIWIDLKHQKPQSFESIKAFVLNMMLQKWIISSNLTYHIGQMSQRSQVSRVALCMPKVKVPGSWRLSVGSWRLSVVPCLYRLVHGGYMSVPGGHLRFLVVILYWVSYWAALDS